MNRKLTDAHVTHIALLFASGRATAEEVLTDAKQPTSPLHDLYDWDLQRAAEEHWLDRTREILRMPKVVVVTETLQIKVPRYLRDPAAEAREQGYVSLAELRTDPVAARRALAQEFERAAGVLKRARGIAVALGLAEEIERLLEQLLGLRRLVSEEPDAEPTTGAEAAGPPAS